MPLGTIVRLTCKELQISAIGSMDNLYKSLENLDVKYFDKETCKAMLLRPGNSADLVCKNLKLNVDDTEAIKYYRCKDFIQGKCARNNSSLSASMLDKCSCGTLMNEWINISYTDGKSFVEGRMFIVTDNLMVVPQSTEPCWALFKDIGIKEVGTLVEKTVSVGSEEILSLLRLSILSTTPLTDILLQHGDGSSGIINLKGYEMKAQTEEKINSDAKITVKITIRKSNNKILYAEAGEDFVEFLFSILALPLGSVVRFLERTPNLGCISTLYKSVEGSEFDRFITSSSRKEILLFPIIAPRLGSKNRILDIEEMVYPTYLYKGITQKTPSNTVDKVTSNAVVNPNPLGIFLKAPEKFIITDNLIVTPFSFISSLSLLERDKVPMDDIEVRVVSVGHEEVHSETHHEYHFIFCSEAIGGFFNLQKRKKMISLKVMVDIKKNQVVFVVSGEDFVDILLSFLTMPIGTIVRLTRKRPQCKT
ncbi:hypothetical protein GIB67_007600 [Kingdonia uniflora]|uniref:DUF674 family protein n=1 Tax=Kingdonia uniflora TaxID=39325 RepID=A0A7J7N190_9MAGN|nr:hypothetical protein GIB67_007600 [Kingdonia uniflora]